MTADGKLHDSDGRAIVSFGGQLGLVVASLHENCATHLGQLPFDVLKLLCTTPTRNSKLADLMELWYQVSIHFRLICF